MRRVGCKDPLATHELKNSTELPHFSATFLVAFQGLQHSHFVARVSLPRKRSSRLGTVTFGVFQKLAFSGKDSHRQSKFTRNLGDSCWAKLVAMRLGLIYLPSYWGMGMLATLIYATAVF